jgi:transcriptional regulator with XRE-family HTH domain
MEEQQEQLVLTFGQRLRVVREQAGLTRQEMAKRLGVSASSYGNYEGGRSLPRDEVCFAVRVEEITGVRPQVLLGLKIMTPHNTTPAGRFRRLDPS